MFYCLTIPIYINTHPSHPQGYNLWDIETQSDDWNCSILGLLRNMDKEKRLNPVITTNFSQNPLKSNFVLNFEARIS